MDFCSWKEGDVYCQYLLHLLSVDPYVIHRAKNELLTDYKWEDRDALSGKIILVKRTVMFKVLLVLRK